jgi:6-phosphogluconolactonase (cycloisomerase 2 family)
VVIRVLPEGGTGDSTGLIQVHNGRFLAAVENRTAGRVWLYSLDAVDGSLGFIKSFETGGESPYDVLYDEPWFFVAHEGTGDVAVFKLDEDAGTLVPSVSSPFSGDGAGAKYLASDGKHVFVSNVGGGTLSVFNLSQEGLLTLNSHSGVSAPGCRSLAVRSARLYVSCPSSGEILIYDIASDGELLTSGASPATGGGLVSPNALIVAGTRIYAANESAASLCGFNVQGDGSLSAIGGSPFAVSSAGAEGLARATGKLFAVTGAGARLLSLSVDSFGVVTEDTGSPWTLTGRASGVAAAGSVVVAATEAGKLEVWTIDELGSLSVADSSPLSVPVDFVRLAISD